MKPYGVKKQDLPKSCSSTGKYGSCKLPNACACGTKNGKRSKDNKGRKAKIRTLKITE